jgi:NAD(P)-dependent dehydrogenase (short-subunit alcohol dehydrogenase family)
MDTFKGKYAVVTGGGTGMGRELARQLAAEGCHVAICDVSATNMADTVAACEAESPAGTRVTSFVADVSKEADLVAFRDHVVDAFGSLDLLFNNAGIGGAGSVLTDPREDRPVGGIG